MNGSGDNVGLKSFGPLALTDAQFAMSGFQRSGIEIRDTTAAPVNLSMTGTTCGSGLALWAEDATVTVDGSSFVVSTTNGGTMLMSDRAHMTMRGTKVRSPDRTSTLRW